MNGNRFRVAASFLALSLLSGGCLVTGSKYEAKTKEADALRDALAGTNKEKGMLEARQEALRKQLADEKEAQASLASRVRALEEENRRLGAELAEARKNYEGTRITREQFISELLEKEKATGKRIQDLGARAQACELALETLRKESAAREAELAELQKLAGTPRDDEALKKERDILLGRVERLTEERRHDEKQRESRFAAAAETIGRISDAIAVTPLGPTLRVYIPEKVLHQKKGGLAGSARQAIAELGKTADAFPSASVILAAGTQKVSTEIRAALRQNAKLPEERIMARHHEKEKGAELLLVVP